MQSVNLQIAPTGISPVINVSQFDVGIPFQLVLYDGASAYNLPAGTTARVEGVKPDNHTFSYTDAVSVTNNVLTITTKEQMTVLAGDVKCEIRLSKNSTDRGTLNFILRVEESPINDNTDPSDTEIPAIIELATQEVYDSEAWAVGTRNGTPVPSTDPQYHNNAKWWADHAGGVNDMTGATSIADGDHGLVPKPLAGDQDKVLGGDATWKTVETTPTQNSKNPVSSGALYSVKEALTNLQDDLTSIYVTGTTNNTGSIIRYRHFFYLNGTLVRAMRDIANGATLTLNTNYELVPKGGLNQISGQIDGMALSGFLTRVDIASQDTIEITLDSTSLYFFASTNNVSPSFVYLAGTTNSTVNLMPLSPVNSALSITSDGLKVSIKNNSAYRLSFMYVFLGKTN